MKARPCGPRKQPNERGLSLYLRDEGGLKSPERQLLLTFLFLFLLTDVGSDLLFVQTHGAYTITARPEVEPYKRSLTTEVLAMDVNRRFAFHVTDRVRKAKLG